MQGTAMILMPKGEHADGSGSKGIERFPQPGFHAKKIQI
jgi:hypothetical protein